MNEDAFNMSVRKFLKTVGVTSQREIEAAVRQASEKGELDSPLNAKIVLTVDGVDLTVKINGTIDVA